MLSLLLHLQRRTVQQYHRSTHGNTSRGGGGGGGVLESLLYPRLLLSVCEVVMLILIIQPCTALLYTHMYFVTYHKVVIVVVYAIGEIIGKILGILSAVIEAYIKEGYLFVYPADQSAGLVASIA